MRFEYLLAVAVCGAAADHGPRAVEIRTVAKSSDADYYAFPSICALANGDLACVFYLGTGHVCPDGKVAIVLSKDHGKTWTEPRVIADTPDDDRDPSIMQTSSGRILVNFFVRNSRLGGAAARGSNRVWVAASDDGGATFSKPRPIDTGWNWEATSDAILELPDSTLLLPMYGRKEGDKTDRAAVVFSTDGGDTWGARRPTTIATDETGKIDFQEPALVRLPDGTLLCSLRTTNAGYHAYECRSTDEGRRWTEPADTGLRGHAAGLLYHSSGAIFHAYRSWSQDGKVRGVAAVVGEPGKPWDPRGEFDLMLVGGDVGYPSAVELPDGSIYCVYYAREHRAIEAAVIGPEAVRALRPRSGQALSAD